MPSKTERPRTDPKDNEARQAERAEKRELNKRTLALAQIIATLYAGPADLSLIESVDMAVAIMRQAKANIGAVK